MKIGRSRQANREGAQRKHQEEDYECVEKWQGMNLWEQ